MIHIDGCKNHTRINYGLRYDVSRHRRIYVGFFSFLILHGSPANLPYLQVTRFDDGVKLHPGQGHW